MESFEQARARRAQAAIIQAPINRACARHVSLRWLAFVMVSHHTLLRSTGPLGRWSIDPKIAQGKTDALDRQRQTAIILSGKELGIVFMNALGQLEAR